MGSRRLLELEDEAAERPDLLDLAASPATVQRNARALARAAAPAVTAGERARRVGLSARQQLRLRDELEDQR